jgi:hypothetical protein
MISFYDGHRIRRDVEALAAELAVLPSDVGEVAAEYIGKALNVEEIEDELAAAEIERRRRETVADAAVIAATADKTTDRIDELRRVISANS